jgi:hypothetical protein
MNMVPAAAGSTPPLGSASSTAVWLFFLSMRREPQHGQANGSPGCPEKEWSEPLPFVCAIARPQRFSRRQHTQTNDIAAMLMRPEILVI